MAFAIAFTLTGAPAALRHGNMVVAGEAAGLQDALFGFGMRYALVSGHLAGDAFATNDLVRYTQD